MIKFKVVQAKGVRADFANGTISLSFSVDMDEQEAAEELATYVNKEGGSLELLITPRQIPLKFSVPEEVSDGN